MAVSIRRNTFLDRQADRMERLFSKAEAPIRIQGGEVTRDQVRYHLSPLSSTSAEDIQSAAEAVAELMGPSRLSVLREAGGLALELQLQTKDNLRLLPLLNFVGDLEELQVVLGMQEEGVPFIVDFRSAGSRHLLIEGPEASGKSELLRTLLLGLTLLHPPSRVQVMAIDLGGRELAVLEALPHHLTELATEPGFALELVEWLERESERRVMMGVQRPDILMLVDDVQVGDAAFQEPFWRGVRAILQRSTRSGIHLVLAGRSLPEMLPEESHDRGRGILRAVSIGGSRANELSSAGEFNFRNLNGRKRVQVAWLSAGDLKVAVDMLHTGGLGSRLVRNVAQT